MPQAAEWHGQAALECLLVDSVVLAARQSDHFNPGDLRAPLGRSECGYYAVVAANPTALSNVTERSRCFFIRLPERASVQSRPPATAGRPDTTNLSPYLRLLRQRSKAGAIIIPNTWHGTQRRIPAFGHRTAGVCRCKGDQYGRR